MKVVKEDISKILARAEITESTQWLSPKKRKRGVFILKSALVSSFLGTTVYYKGAISVNFRVYHYWKDFNSIFMFKA